MYYYVSLCNIPLLTSSLEPLHGFSSKFALTFLRWTPTKFVKIGVLTLFFMELWVILCQFWLILKKSIKPLIMTEELVIHEIRIDEAAGRGDSDSRMTSFEVIMSLKLQSTKY